MVECLGIKADLVLKFDLVETVRRMGGQLLMKAQTAFANPVIRLKVMA